MCDVYTGKAINALCTVALKLLSMCVRYIITDESAKAFGNGVQVLLTLTIIVLTLLSVLAFFLLLTLLSLLYMAYAVADERDLLN